MATTIDEAYRNGRVVLDVTMSSDKVTRIDEMNGHQGDNGRIVKFVMVGQQGRPFNMENRSLDLVGCRPLGNLARGKWRCTFNSAVFKRQCTNGN